MKHARKWSLAMAAGMLLALLVLYGPVATWLQSRQSWINPKSHEDAIYLVCGARAQDRRITALTNWLESKSKVEAIASPISAFSSPTLLIGNDPQKSLWCRKHQTNHTKTEWAVEKLTTNCEQSTVDDSHLSPPQSTLPLSHPPLSTVHSPQSTLPPPTISIVPGTFTNTDGEMAALATYLHEHPEIGSIALVTSRFHARRSLQRFRTHVGTQIAVGLIPGVKYWENRAPWIVLGELLKMLRDRLHLSQILTRPVDYTSSRVEA